MQSVVHMYGMASHGRSRSRALVGASDAPQLVSLCERHEIENLVTGVRQQTLVPTTDGNVQPRCPFRHTAPLEQQALMAHPDNESHNAKHYADSKFRGPFDVLKEATSFVYQFFDEVCNIKDQNATQVKERIVQIVQAIMKDGTYEQTTAELQFSARLAWRNSSRCINRAQWNNLHLLDCRQAQTTQDMYDAIITHLREACVDGVVRAIISVFPQKQQGLRGFQIWNPQLVMFAGYPATNGGSGPTNNVLGDPNAVEFTKVCLSLGWDPRHRTAFDVLPLVLEAPGGSVDMYNVPEDLHRIVHISHWKHSAIDDMGLQWTAIPVISNFVLDCGGLVYTAAPFNGWFAGTEVCRDLLDVQRYNRADAIARALQLDVSNKCLWLDEVQLIVNQAILHSFQASHVSIIDHHTASKGFVKFFKEEHAKRGGCPADWVWIVPPAAGSMTEVFHQEMINYQLKPFYASQPPAWRERPIILNEVSALRLIVCRLFANFTLTVEILESQVETFYETVTVLLRELGETVLARAHTVIVTRGDLADALYFVLNGSVSLHLEVDSAPVTQLSKGSWFGLSALIHGGGRRDINVIAAEETQLLRIDYSTFVSCLKQASMEACDGVDHTPTLLITAIRQHEYQAFDTIAVLQPLLKDPTTRIKFGQDTQLTNAMCGDIIYNPLQKVHTTLFYILHGSVNVEETSGDTYTLHSNTFFGYDLGSMFAGAPLEIETETETQTQTQAQTQAQSQTQPHTQAHTQPHSNTQSECASHMYSASVTVTSKGGAEIVSFGSTSAALVSALGLSWESLPQNKMGGERKGNRVYVLFATEMGTAADFAELTYRAIFNHFKGCKTKAKSVEDVCFMSLDDFHSDLACQPLFDSTTTVLIVSSTSGVGEAPANALHFTKWLQALEAKAESNNTNEQLQQRLQAKFSVLGLGSSAYPHTYCTFPSYLDTALATLGGVRYSPLVLADEIHGQLDSMRKWHADVVLLIRGNDEVEVDVADADADADADVDADADANANGTGVDGRGKRTSTIATMPAFHVVQVNTTKARRRTRTSFVQELRYVDDVTRANPSSSRSALMSRRDVSDDGQLMQVVFDVEELANTLEEVDDNDGGGWGWGGGYQSGDTVSVLPQNSEATVNSMLPLVDVRPLHDGDSEFTLSPGSRYLPVHMRERTWTVRTLLTEAVELHNPKEALIVALSKLGVFDATSTIAEYQHTPPTALEFATFVKSKRLPLSQALEYFSTGAVKIPLDALLKSCDWIMRRLYSISSSPTTSPNQIYLTVKKLRFTIAEPAHPRDNGQRVGFATSYLTSLAQGSTTEIAIKPNPSFHLQSNKNVILIGAGSGVAPFRGFWEEWRTDCSSIDRACIFLGWTSPSAEAYAKDICELQQTVGTYTSNHDGGAHNKISYHQAYSRVPNVAKCHVQDSLVQHSQEVWEQLELGASVYLCGMSQMVQTCLLALQEIARKHGLENHEIFSQQLIDQGRLHMDVFTTL